MWGQTARVMALCAACALLSGCKEDLYSNLTEAEANEIVSVLYRAGTDASRTIDKDGTASVTVDKADFARAVEVLKAQGYPKRDYLTLGDVFQGDGFVVSQMEERARFIFAMTEELSRTIAEIDDVLSARVHVVLPTSDPMSRSRAPSSASVAIRHLEASPTSDLLPQIKMLVANSIEGLSYDKVSVVFIPVAKPAPPVAEPQDVTPTAADTAGNPGWVAGGSPLNAPVVLAGVVGGGIVIVLFAILMRVLRRRLATAIPKVRIVPTE